MAIAFGQEQVAQSVTVARFTNREVEQAARLINGLGIVGSQILFRCSAVLYRRAYALLQKIKQQDEPFLKRLDELARSSNDESALKLIDDLGSLSNDVAKNLNLARRCLAASAFLGHCIVVHVRTEATLVTPGQSRLVH